MKYRLLAIGGPLLIVLGLTSIASAHEAIHGDLRIAHPWVAAAGGDTHAAYGYAIEIENKGNSRERLMGASLETAGAGTLRSSRDENGVRKFATIENGLVIEAGKSIELAPGKSQIYFPHFEGEPPEGGIVKGTLIFEKAGAIPVNFMVEPASAAQPDIPGATGDDQSNMKHEHHGHH